MVSRKSVSDFLQQMKDKIRVFGIVFRQRQKNTQALASLDIKPFERNNHIMSLQPEDCFSGPNADTYDESNPDYYEFGKDIKGQNIYIKVSIGKKDKPVDCMSFHPAERAIKYPLKE